MLPSEITGPGPHFGGGAVRDGGAASAAARRWVEATGAGTRHASRCDRNPVVPCPQRLRRWPEAWCDSCGGTA